MSNSKRRQFEREVERVRNIDDPAVRDALLDLKAALDPEDHHEMVPKLRRNGTIEHESKANTTGGNYLKVLRLAHERDLDLLGADVETVNNYMKDLISEPSSRRYDLVDYDGKLKKSSATQWQSALRTFYRFCTEPGHDDRADVAIEWPADGIIMFINDSGPKHDESDMTEQADLDALREACVAHSLNTRRDRAFLEVASGTGQRVYALITLKVKHVNVGPDQRSHVLLNPAIKNDGDKGAIKNTGRWKPIVSDPGPIEKWIEHHPLQDPDVRARYGCPDNFEECYLFIGDINSVKTDPSTHWDESSPLDMLKRRKRNTADMPNVKTVDVPVDPHNWRHYAYTKSKELPIDESIRRKVFGWVRGSDTGETTYGHGENKRAGELFAEAWEEEFGDGSEEGGPPVAEQVAGAISAGGLPADASREIAEALMSDQEFMDAIGRRAAEAID